MYIVHTAQCVVSLCVSLCRLNDVVCIWYSLFAFSNMAQRTQTHAQFVYVHGHISGTNHFWVDALVASPNAYAEHYASVTFSGWHLEHCNKCTFIALSLAPGNHRLVAVHRPHCLHVCASMFVCVYVCGVSLLLLLLSIDVVVCHSVIVFNRNSIDYTQRNAKTRNRQKIQINEVK